MCASGHVKTFPRHIFRVKVELLLRCADSTYFCTVLVGVQMKIRPGPHVCEQIFSSCVQRISKEYAATLELYDHAVEEKFHEQKRHCWRRLPLHKLPSPLSTCFQFPDMRDAERAHVCDLVRIHTHMGFHMCLLFGPLSYRTTMPCTWALIAIYVTLPFTQDQFEFGGGLSSF